MKDEDYNIPENLDYVNTVSSTDCTGLIPAGTVKEDELNAYKEMYSFGQPVMTEEENRNMRSKNARETGNGSV